MATFDNMGLEENLVEFIISNISHIYQSKYNTTEQEPVEEEQNCTLRNPELTSAMKSEVDFEY